MNKLGILYTKAKNGFKGYGNIAAIAMAAVSLVTTMSVPGGFAIAATVSAANLHLVKVVSGGDASPSDWTLTATLQGESEAMLSGAGQVEGVIAPGTYVLAETGDIPGYIAGNWSCVDTVNESEVTVDDGEIVLSPDSHVECTITNTFAAENSNAPQLHIIKVVCSSYGMIAGNELADLYDQTNGNYVNFTNYSESDPYFPAFNGYVNPSEIPEGCQRANGWNFKLSSDHDQQNDVQNVVTVNNGEYTTALYGTGSDLSAALQDSAQNGILWVSESDDREGYGFGAFRCYGDGFHGDKLEVIETYDSTYQDDIYCIAYNVSQDDNGGNGDGTTVHGLVYKELSGDNEFTDGTDEVLPNMVVKLIQVTDPNPEATGDTLTETEKDSDVSDENGHYEFMNVMDGCYIVRELPESYVQTEPAVAPHEYYIAVGKVNCDFNNDEVPSKLLSFFFNVAQAAQDDVNFVQYSGQLLAFGNFAQNSGGGSSSGSHTPKDDNGQVGGDSTGTPSDPNGQVLGATTELPRTGMPAAVLLTFLAIIAMVTIPKLEIKK